MARSLNRVQLIGNLTRDPELRYTPNGAAVCSFSIATNRSWTTDTGEKREEVDFHRIVAWNKLAELCSQFLVKGRKTYVEGRLSTRNWTGQDGTQKTTTEVVIDDMILLDNKGGSTPATSSPQETKNEKAENNTEEEKGVGESKDTKASKKKEKEAGTDSAKGSDKEEEVMPDDIPF
jgi:single-strand DNA-binding protein